MDENSATGEGMRRLSRALTRAVSEHGAPNRFGCGELNLYGGPGAMLAGRIGRHHLVELAALFPVRDDSGAEVAVHYERDRRVFRIGGRICEMCAQERKNAGPFRDSRTGQRWASVCGGCKIRHTMAQPGVKQSLERAARAALLAPIVPTGEA